VIEDGKQPLVRPIAVARCAELWARVAARLPDLLS
jgi:hypothetical protein